MDLQSDLSSDADEVTPEVEEQTDLAAAVEEVDASEPETKVSPPEEADEAPEVHYESLNDVLTAVSSMPPEVRSHVAPIISLAREAESDFILAKQGYDEAKTQLVDFANDLKDYGVDSEPVVEKFQAQQDRIHELNAECIKTTWSSFQKLHPDYSGQSTKIKNTFSKIVSSMLDKFPGESTLDKLEEAYKYAAYTTGEKEPVTPKQVAAATETNRPEPVVPKTPVNVDSRAQALVTDGTRTTSRPMVDVADMSWNEILDRHLHMLEDDRA